MPPVKAFEKVGVEREGGGGEGGGDELNVKQIPFAASHFRGDEKRPPEAHAACADFKERLRKCCRLIPSERELEDEEMKSSDSVIAFSSQGVRNGKVNVYSNKGTRHVISLKETHRRKRYRCRQGCCRRRDADHRRSSRPP